VKLSSRSLGRSIAGALALLAGSVAFGHHSTAMFDMQHAVTITGTVTRFDWTNPHTFIWIDTGDGSAEKVEYSIEGMSPNYLSRNGWNHSTLKAGDKISMEIYPLKDGRKGGFCVSVTFADGHMLHNLPPRPSGPPPSPAAQQPAAGAQQYGQQ
jgi:hypothetical protein